MTMHDDPIDDPSDDIETTALGADAGPKPALEPGAPAEAHPPVSNARAAGWDNAVPGWGYTVLIILATATPLLVIFYLGNLLLGLPFPPFDLFQWLDKIVLMPWAGMIDVLAGWIGNRELLRWITPTPWIWGTALYILIALVVGSLFHVVRRQSGRSCPVVTLAFGLLFAAPLFLAGPAMERLTLTTGVAAAWLAGWGIVWALIVDYAFGRSMKPSESQLPDSVAPDGIDRRQFLVQFGAGAAAITAIGGAVVGVAGQSERPRTLPLIRPELFDAQRELFSRFRRFAIVRDEGGRINVLALGAEYPDRNYVSVWIGAHSPIIIYGDLQTALAAFGSDEDPVGLFFIDE